MESTGTGAGQGLARTKGLIAISPCRSLQAKLVFLAICRWRWFVQEPTHTVLPISNTVGLYHDVRACSAIGTMNGTLRRIHGVECGHSRVQLSYRGYW
ncbi:hypothetical protein HDV63DRAFT_15568 [Trichoderma sp. SZMC 28014]